MVYETSLSTLVEISTACISTGKLPCPTCREMTTLPPTGVSGLRNDFKIQKMEEMFRSMYVREQQQQHSNNHSGNVCGPCQAQKKTVDVTIIRLLFSR